MESVSQVRPRSHSLFLSLSSSLSLALISTYKREPLHDLSGRVRIYHSVKWLGAPSPPGKDLALAGVEEKVGGVVVLSNGHRFENPGNSRHRGGKFSGLFEIDPALNELTF